MTDKWNSLKFNNGYSKVVGWYIEATKQNRETVTIHQDPIDIMCRSSTPNREEKNHSEGEPGKTTPNKCRDEL